MTEITDYFSKIGRKGGSKTSERKKESGRKNAEKARQAKAKKLSTHTY